MEILEREIKMDNGGVFEFENPQKDKIINNQSQFFEDLEYQTEYEEIRERNK